MIQEFLELFRVVWCLQSLDKLVLGVMYMSKNPMSVRILPKWNRTNISPKCSRIALRSFWATPFLKFTIEMVPSPSPQTPNLDFPQIFPDSLWEVFFFFAPSRATWRWRFALRNSACGVFLFVESNSFPYVQLRSSKQVHSCRKSGKSFEKCGLGVHGVWGSIFIASFKKR